MIIVPDSSFYICFLKDINEPRYLMRILDYKSFNFLTGRKILDEVKRITSNHQCVEEIEKKVRIFEYADYGEILRPFISMEEIKMGEHCRNI